MQTPFRLFLTTVIAAMLFTSCSNAKKTTATDSTITGTTWKLTEVLGEPVAGRGAAGEPHIIFKAGTGKVTGSASCNNFNGSYEISKGNKLHLSPLVATKRGCADMKTEISFFRMAGMVAGYTIKDDTLQLTDADGKTVASFRAAK